jgi:methanogenic corrinoid protein MtbC1
MKNNKQRLIELIHNQDRSKATTLTLSMLESEEISITELYEDVLTKALYDIDCKEGDRECIWREHVETSIVRTIIESTYQFIIKKKKENNGIKVIVLCPTEEYHEIGARMAHDYFLLNGYESTFIGANTPLEVILDAVRIINPTYVAISVTNYYHIIDAKKVVEALKQQNPNLKICAGGQAFNHVDALSIVNADHHLTNFESIGDLK